MRGCFESVQIHYNPCKTLCQKAWRQSLCKGFNLIVKMFAQINRADAFIIDQFFRFSTSKNSAITDDVCLVANAQGFAHVVVGNQDADIFLF